MNWDFKNHHVQRYDNTEISSQLGAKAILISVGPPTFEQANSTVVMGFVQNISMQQQRQIMQIFEIGSERRYFVDNPHQAMVQLSRALISGPSLLKVLGSGILNRGISPGENTGTYGPANIFSEGDINAVAAHADSNLWINLASDLFNNPLGIKLDFREFHGDGSSSGYGSLYLENCKVQGHGISIAAQSWLVQEDSQMMFEYAIPLIKGSTVKESHQKRKEIMESLTQAVPDWYNNHQNWDGLLRAGGRGGGGGSPAGVGGGGGSSMLTS